MTLECGSGDSGSTPGARTKEFYCKNCRKFCRRYYRGYEPIYCSRQCHQEFAFNDKYERWLSGEVGVWSSLGGAKRALIKKDGYFCKVCKIEDWQGRAISLHVDHIDGNRNNHHVYNMRLLCPNCHSQTPNHGTKNRGKFNYPKVKRVT